MKIILRKEVESLGKIGDVVRVSDGYARNFLFPQKLAMEATDKSIKFLERERKVEEANATKELREAEALSGKINQLSCTIVKQAGENDKLFGSVTSGDIFNSLKDESIIVDKKNIRLDEPIKSLGVFNVPIKIHPQVTASLKVWVVKK
ncbi:MAG: 50S ribosomal protein L9 [bacterium]